jgi:hypothetical protein
VKCETIVLLGLVALATASCGRSSGSDNEDGDTPPGNGGSVTGAALGEDFSFTPAKMGATLVSSLASDAELAVFLCETSDCPELGGSSSTTFREVSLAVQGATADIRSGKTFVIGSDAVGMAMIRSAGQSQTDPALSGEVVIESSDIRLGGNTVGTFQLELASGSEINGFFEAPFTRISGPTVALNPLRAPKSQSPLP